MKISRPYEYGLISVRSMLILGIFIVFLGFIIIPLVIKISQDRQKNACIANLTLLQSAKFYHAREKGGKTVTAADVFGPGKYINQSMSCPAGGAYTIGAVGVKPTCSVSGHTY